MIDKDLIDIIEEHLKHEIDMLRRTYTQLSVVSVDPDRETDEQRTVRNALIESFCVHARSLLYFFANKTLKATDAIAEEFTTGFTKIDFSDKSVEALREKVKQADISPYKEANHDRQREIQRWQRWDGRFANNRACHRTFHELSLA